MVNIRDGGIYRISSVTNDWVASYSRGEFVPGAVLTVRPYDQLEGEYESRFVAKSVAGDKWKFTLIHNPSVALGFYGSPNEGPIPVSTVRDDGNSHTEWSVDPGSGEHESLIHTSVDGGSATWTLPDGPAPGIPVILQGQNGSPGQQWKIGVPVDD